MALALCIVRNDKHGASLALEQAAVRAACPEIPIDKKWMVAVQFLYLWSKVESNALCKIMVPGPHLGIPRCILV